jgi:hypothetical protein
MSKFWGRNIEIDGSWYATRQALDRETRGAATAVLPNPIRALGVAPNNIVQSYEFQVQQVLRNIETGSSIGRMLMNRINGSSCGLKIVPVGVDEILRNGDTTPVKCGPAKCFRVSTDVVIAFEPTAWNTPRFDVFTQTFRPVTGPIDPNGNFQPEDVLFHELVHTLRLYRGLFRPTPMGDFFETVEEYYAILLTNMYVTEVGRPKDRRADHRYPFRPLSAKPGLLSDTPQDFYFAHKDELERFIREMPDLCAPLGAAANPIAWNPIKAAVNNSTLNDQLDRLPTST